MLKRGMVLASTLILLSQLIWRRATSARISGTLPEAMTRPLASTATRVASASASSR